MRVADDTLALEALGLQIKIFKLKEHTEYINQNKANYKKQKIDWENDKLVIRCICPMLRIIK